MIGATGSVQGKKEFEPSSLAAESKPLLGPHLEDYWSRRGLLGPLWRTIGLIGPFHLGRSVSTLSPYHGRLGRVGGKKKNCLAVRRCCMIVADPSALSAHVRQIAKMGVDECFKHYVWRQSWV